VRTARRLLALSALGLALLVATAGAASAHPLGNFTINTYDGVVVVPGEVRVQYVLDMAEIPTFQLSHTLDANGDGTTSRPELAAFAQSRAAELVGQVEVRAEGLRVALSVRSASAELRPGQAGLHCLRLEAVFAAPVRRSGSLSLADHTYADHIGWHEITAIGAHGAVVTGSNVPTRTISDTLLRYPTNLLSNPLDVTSARFSFHPGTSGALPVTPVAGGAGSRPGVTGGPFARLATWTGLSLPALLLALLLAAAFGAAHALLPGHGKTLMAAYLVGRGGRLRQAAQVGVAVAFMHSASVLALGLAILGLQVVAPDRIYPWVTLATGLLVIGMGAGLAIVRLRDARRGVAAAHGHAHAWESDHVYSELEHEHVHTEHLVLAEKRELVLAGVARGHEHAWADAFPTVTTAHPVHVHGNTQPADAERAGPSGTVGRFELDRPLSRRGLAALAVAGGILPSPTAIVVLLATFSAHRVAFGLALILAFSAGMAAALVGVGIVALRARRAVTRHLSGRFVQALPVATALVIVGIGAFLVVKGAAGL
jgi:nickel/cobalt exporter